jgi:hypothetical protein
VVLAEDERARHRWWTAWFVAYAALTVGQAGVAIGTTDPGLRADMAVGAAFSAIGNLGLALFPGGYSMPIETLAVYPEHNAAERRAKLTVAERLLDKSAREEAIGRAWYTHVLGSAVAAASGVVLAVGYDRVASGAINVVAGIAVAELQIWTQPTVARDVREARGSHLGKLDLVVAPLPGGIAIRGTF